MHKSVKMIYLDNKVIKKIRKFNIKMEPSESTKKVVY